MANDPSIPEACSIGVSAEVPVAMYLRHFCCEAAGTPSVILIATRSSSADDDTTLQSVDVELAHGVQLHAIGDAVTIGEPRKPSQLPGR